MTESQDTTAVETPVPSPWKTETTYVDPMAELYADLAAAQAEFDTPTKNCTNPAFRSKYADLANILAAVRPALNAHGLAVLQRVKSVAEGVTVETVLVHKSGASISSGELFMPVSARGSNAAQAFGSARTYACRYSLSSFLGVAADDDDDANGAAEEKSPKNSANGKKAAQSAVKQAPAERPAPAPAPQLYRLTESDLDAAHGAACGGMKAYEAYFNSLSKPHKRALVDSGWHDKFKGEAAEADQSGFDDVPI